MFDFWKKWAKKKISYVNLPLDSWWSFECRLETGTSHQRNGADHKLTISVFWFIKRSRGLINIKHSYQRCRACKPSVGAGVIPVSISSRWYGYHKFNESNQLSILPTRKQRSQSITHTFLSHSLLICRVCSSSVRVLAVSLPNDFWPAVRGEGLITFSCVFNGPAAFGPQRKCAMLQQRSLRGPFKEELHLCVCVCVCVCVYVCVCVCALVLETKPKEEFWQFTMWDFSFLMSLL